MKVYVLQNKRGDVLGVFDTFIEANTHMHALATVKFGGLHYDTQGNNETYAGAIGVTSEQFSRYDFVIHEHTINSDEIIKFEKQRAKYL